MPPTQSLPPRQSRVLLRLLPSCCPLVPFRGSFGPRIACIATHKNVKLTWLPTLSSYPPLFCPGCRPLFPRNFKLMTPSLKGPGRREGPGFEAGQGRYRPNVCWWFIVHFLYYGVPAVISRKLVCQLAPRKLHCTFYNHSKMWYASRSSRDQVTLHSPVHPFDHLRCHRMNVPRLPTKFLCLNRFPTNLSTCCFEQLIRHVAVIIVMRHQALGIGSVPSPSLTRAMKLKYFISGGRREWAGAGEKVRRIHLQWSSG